MGTIPIPKNVIEDYSSMPKKFFRRCMPDPRKIREHKYLQFFGTLLHDPNLWHLNRRSVSGAFAVGLFVAMIPIPFQMVVAAAFAIFTRVNLPIAAGLAWVTNPFTVGPMFYFAYKVGTWILHVEPRDFNFELSYDWLMAELGAIWAPFLLGCLIVGLVLAVAGYISIRLVWRIYIANHIKKRRQRRASKQSANHTPPSSQKRED